MRQEEKEQMIQRLFWIDKPADKFVHGITKSYERNQYY